MATAIFFAISSFVLIASWIYVAVAIHHHMKMAKEKKKSLAGGLVEKS